MKLMFAFYYKALHLAVKYENTDIIKVLLSSKNIDVNVKDGIQFEYKSNYKLFVNDFFYISYVKVLLIMPETMRSNICYYLN